QQFGLAAVACCFEGLLQPIGQEVRPVERQLSKKLQTSRADVADIHRHVLPQASSDAQREVLYIRGYKIRVIDIAAPAGNRLAKVDRHRLHGLDVVRHGNATNAAAGRWVQNVGEPDESTRAGLQVWSEDHAWCVTQGDIEFQTPSAPLIRHLVSAAN